ncbi:bleomycin resistance protein [Polymorphum gilvum]|uniref:Glyoxalase/bleomycin resistance protein/dioxygenase n=1 Tax=Polymorphum gilvum (strain LMG 25793 / CGMCC 1.9160 / SL003B-26A1) TaxID=991905 RepID=F2J5R4_POLGS|nr:VOC family protein [Polymorphum gilvum]ADZ70147.1 Glyoxalase/bleomycin resistance protein/dioxygenase [Polymorphum gilvum SL003B-26A1]
MADDRLETIPILPSLNIGETRGFYAGTLGFDTSIYGAEGYLIARRRPIEIHFWLTDDAHLCHNTALYVRGGGVDALYEEFRAAGVPRLGPYEIKPWGMKEFHIIDPHGNLLRFGLIPPEAAGERDLS